MIKINEQAPNFTLPDNLGEMRKLADYKGKFLIIYFYPKDDTPGCTKESSTFRDLSPKFKDKNCIILGISKDSINSHEKFIKKLCLPFKLLSDENHTVIQEYGAWQKKSMYGKSYMGIQRSTVLISPEGKVLYHWEKVKNAEQHPQEVLKKLEDFIAQKTH